MKRLYVVIALLLGPVLVLGGTVLALPHLPGARFGTSQEWPFGDGSQGSSVLAQRSDVVVMLGATALVPGSVVIAGLDVMFGVDPFFTDSRTELTVLPTFAATQSLETGWVFDWWSATVGLDLTLAPWALTSIDGWLELHPPAWGSLTTPRISLEGDIGWGPRWSAVADWSHEIGGFLDVLAVWKTETLWGNSLDLSAETTLEATWTLPSSAFLTDWMVQLEARSILPLFENSPVTLRAGVSAQAYLLPEFGFGFDVRLELRAGTFTAYGVVGAGNTGIRAEMGLEWLMGFSLLD